MNKGEIYAPYWCYSDCEHYVVCMEDCDDSTEVFNAVLISHGQNKPEWKIKNHPMEHDWFLDTDDNGNAYKVVYDHSMLVGVPYEKVAYKVNLTKIVGHLSEDGVKEVEKLMHGISPIKNSNKTVKKESLS